MSETYPINIWINEDRYEKLKNAGLGDMPQERLAGMKVLSIPNTAEQRDTVLQLFPMGKFDAATTKTIEMLPKDVKDELFDLALAKKTVDVMTEFLARHK